MSVASPPNDEHDGHLALEQMLARPSLVPPTDFEQRVLARLEALQAEAAMNTEVPIQPKAFALPTGTLLFKYLLKPLRILALVGSGAFAFTELLAFVFGLWTVSTAL
jgi:hypothetical protein